MPAQIKFGTSGWLAVMDEKFTFANLRRAVTGIARYLSSPWQVARRAIARAV